MSRVLVISDSHGFTEELEVIRERHRKEVDLLVHCGDSQLMPDHPSISGYFAVGGNCDFGNYPQEVITNVGGKKFYITHGHHYDVKYSLMNLKYKAQEVKADIVCFGHSHELGAELVDGILFLNPGSVRLPRGRMEKTYCILDVQNDTVKLSVYDISGRELENLSKEFVF